MITLDYKQGDISKVLFFNISYWKEFSHTHFNMSDIGNTLATPTSTWRDRKHFHDRAARVHDAIRDYVTDSTV